MDSTEKASGTARPSRTKSHPPGYSSPASQAGRRVGTAFAASLALPKKTAFVGKAAFGLSSMYCTYSSFVLEP
jgi:hypothetical protein